MNKNNQLRKLTVTTAIAIITGCASTAVSKNDPSRNIASIPAYSNGCPQIPLAPKIYEVQRNFLNGLDANSKKIATWSYNKNNHFIEIYDPNGALGGYVVNKGDQVYKVYDCQNNLITSYRETLGPAQYTGTDIGLGAHSDMHSVIQYDYADEKDRAEGPAFGYKDNDITLDGACPIYQYNLNSVDNTDGVPDRQGHCPDALFSPEDTNEVLASFGRIYMNDQTFANVEKIFGHASSPTHGIRAMARSMESVVGTTTPAEGVIEIKSLTAANPIQILASYILGEETFTRVNEASK